MWSYEMEARAWLTEVAGKEWCPRCGMDKWVDEPCPHCTTVSELQALRKQIAHEVEEILKLSFDCTNTTEEV